MGYKIIAPEDPADSDTITLLDGDKQAPLLLSSIWQKYKRATIVVVLCATNLVTFLLAGHYYNIDTSYCLPWQGPLLDRLAVDIYETQRDDILLPNASIPRHIYRLPPSPEVDAAWEALSHNGLIAVSEDEVRRAGKDPTLALKIPEDWGYEPNMYLALLDGVHQVHCLNMIRKSLVNNYEYYYGQQYNFTPPIFTQAHVNHCLDSLLQDLMCYADSHITLFNWVDGQPGAQPDFAVNRVCRDYNTLMQWFDDNQIPDWQAKAKHLHRQPFDKARPRFAGWNEYVNGILAGYDGDVPLGTMSGLPPSCTAT